MAAYIVQAAFMFGLLRLSSAAKYLPPPAESEPEYLLDTPIWSVKEAAVIASVSLVCQPAML